MECCDKDLHSGVFGGSVHEAMTDLITLMGELRSHMIRPVLERTFIVKVNW